MASGLGTLISGGPNIQPPSAESLAKGCLAFQVWLVACHGQKSYQKWLRLIKCKSMSGPSNDLPDDEVYR